MRRTRLVRPIALVLVASTLHLSWLCAVPRVHAGDPAGVPYQDPYRRSSPGVKTVLVGGLVGAAALFAISAMTGPAKVMATAGAAGTGFAAPVGSALGTMMTGVKGMAAGVGTAGRGMISAIGLGGGGASTGLLGFLMKPWILIPLAVIAAGMLAWYFYNNHYSARAYARDNFGRYDREYGRRYDNPYYGGRTPNPYAGPGYGPGMMPRLSFWDRFKTTVTGGTYVPPGLYMGGYYGQAGNFFTGGPAAFAVNNVGFVNGFAGLNPGLGYGFVPPPLAVRGAGGIGLPSQSGLVDRVGQGLMDSDTVRAVERRSLQPASQPSTTAIPDSVRKAREAKTAAYQRLLEALRRTADGDRTVDVRKIIAEYKAADDALKAASVEASPGDQ